MSVTFWIPQAPTELVRPFADEPEYTCEEAIPPFTEINMANGNARAILEMIYPEDGGDLCGQWEGPILDKIIRRLLDAVNRRASVEALTIDTMIFGRNRVLCGHDEDYVRGRLTQLMVLARAAKDHGFYVVYV